MALACVPHNGDNDPHTRTELARSMLVANPDLATESIAAFTVTGHRQAMNERIKQDPKIVNRPCCPNNWPPLLHCCYSILPTRPGRPSLSHDFTHVRHNTFPGEVFMELAADALRTAFAVHGGLEPDLLDEVTSWIEQYWQYALLAAVAIIRQGAEHSGTPLEMLVSDLAAGSAIDIS